MKTDPPCGCNRPIRTHSADQTRWLAAKIAEYLDRGSVLALTGDLGSGKTCFVQGLARGLQVPEECPITSPTFTLVNEYPGRLTLYHIDLYRIEDESGVEDLGLEEMLDGAGIVAIEWAERIRSVLPEDSLEVHLEILGDRKREITVCGMGKAAGIIKNFAENRTPENTET